MKRVRYLVHNPINSPYKRGPLGLPFNGQEDSLMIFLKIISCRSDQPTLRPPFTQKGYHYSFWLQGYHNLTTKQRFRIKGLRSNIQGHMSFIHTRLRVFSILRQDISYLHRCMYQVRDTSLPHKTHQYFTLSNIAYHSRNTYE